jgi:hypothetical protein
MTAFPVSSDTIYIIADDGCPVAACQTAAMSHISRPGAVLAWSGRYPAAAVDIRHGARQGTENTNGDLIM